MKLYDEWMHPLGLYMAMSLMRHNGWDVAYINCLQRDRTTRVKRHGTGDFPAVEIDKPVVYEPIPRRYKRYGISSEALTRKMATLRRPDVVLVGSGMTYWLEGLEATVAAVRARWASVPLVVGGIAATLIPRIIRSRLPGVHLAEGPLPSAITAIEEACGIPGAFDVTDWTPDLREGLSLTPTLHHAPLLMSLGCPMRCSYCASRILQPKLTYRPRDTILAEVRFALERGVRDFSLYDDALLYRAREHFLPLLGEVSRLGGGRVRLHAPNGMHVRWLDRKVADAMKAAGFVTIRLGYESGSRVYARDTGAKADLTALRRAVNALRRAGFAPRAIGVYLMGGLPGQTPGDLLTELDAVGALGVLPKPVFLSPVPGTELFERYARRFPRLRDDPLWHNDTFFITRLEGWGRRAVEEIRGRAREWSRNAG
jgi:radical SAM superfamily enzyme YgiQ (UPF0313 family)